MRALAWIAAGAWVALPVLALAQSPVGPEFQVNTSTIGDQSAADIAVDTEGRFVVAWASYPPTGYGLFARRFSADGAALDDEFAVNTTTTGFRFAPALAIGPDSFHVIWGGQSDLGHGVVGRTFDPGGSPLGGEFMVNTATTGRHGFGSVAADATGGFVALWSHRVTSSSDQVVYAQVFDPAGAAVGPEFQVTTSTTTPQSPSRHSLARTPDGGFIVVWSAPGDGGGSGIFGRRFDAMANALGPEFLVNVLTSGHQLAPAVAVDGEGDFVVVWTTGADFYRSDIVARRFEAAGIPQGGEITVNQQTSGRQPSPAVAADARGNFFVVWNSPVADEETYDTFGRAFNAEGPVSDEFALGTVMARAQRSPSIVATASGDFVVAWTAHDFPGSFGVFARRFLGDHIFADDFESGTLAAWSSAVDGGGDLAATGAAALRGANGLRATVDDTAGLYVQDDSPRGEQRYRARFWVDPNGFDPGLAQAHLRTRVFVAFTDAPARRVLAIVLRLKAGVYSLMARARLDDDRQAETPFFDVTDAPHAVEIDLQPASAPDRANGRLELFIDGVSRAELTGLANSEALVDFVRLGALSVKGGASGALYWDDLESRRFSYIGP